MNNSHISPSGRYWHYAVESFLSGPHVVALTNSLSIAQTILSTHCYLEDDHGPYLAGRIWRYEALDAESAMALGFPFPHEQGEQGQLYNDNWIWSPAK